MSLALGLARALDSHAKNQELDTAFRAIIRAYFEEYTDATELDGHTYSAIDALFNFCFTSGETDDGKELDTLINEVKEELGR